MTELRVIDGIKKEKPNYRKLYANAYINTLNSTTEEQESIVDMDLDTRKKLILYGVKNINATDLEILDYELLVNAFTIISGINSIMGTLTPRELLTVFPIAKEYDGEKYEMKDYFYTKKCIEEFGMDQVIGEEMKRFLWDYHNWELVEFASQTMCVMSAIRRAEGGKGIAEEFFEDRGVPTYTMTEDQQGKQFLTNNDTGEVQEGISFRDALHDCMISTFDDECKEMLDDSIKGKLSNDVFHEEASAVFGSFLTDLYTENHEKFLELAKPIYDEYCRMKSEDDAHWKREQLKNANLSLIVNKKLTPKLQLRE